MFESAINDLTGLLATEPLPGDAAALVDELRALEILKCAAEARQARLAAALESHQRAEAERAGEPYERRSRGVGLQVALARRMSGNRGQQALGLANILARELPYTRAAFDAGRISEWRATLIARETACLSREHRAHVDQVIAEDATALEQRGDREIISEVRRLAARLDAAAVAARRRRAESERRVTIRPAPDSMVYLTALLPVGPGVGVYAALKQAADTAVGVGEATNVGQAMADELVRRVTKPSPETSTAQPVALNLSMPAESLLLGADEPGELADFGPVPAELARSLIADSLDDGQRVWVKRLFTRPDAGELIAMDSRARLFPKPLAEFIGLRDRFCRNVYCGARIRHTDHVQDHADGGPTSAINGQGLCEACSYAKQAPGWRSRQVPGERHTVLTTTPTGHQYVSTAPVF